MSGIQTNFGLSTGQNEAGFKVTDVFF